MKPLAAGCRCTIFRVSGGIWQRVGVGCWERLRSNCARNGDYMPTRFDSQTDAANLLCGAKCGWQSLITSVGWHGIGAHPFRKTGRMIMNTSTGVCALLPPFGTHKVPLLFRSSFFLSVFLVSLWWFVSMVLLLSVLCLLF